MTKTRSCKCATKVNKLLEAQNEELVLSIRLSSGQAYAVILTQKIDPKKRTKKHTLLATYCPFCGKKYPERSGK